MKQYDSRVAPPLAAALWVPRPSRWSRLTRTQQLSVRGAAILGGAVLLTATLGATSGRPNPLSAGGVYAGTLSLEWLRNYESTLDSTRNELARARDQLERARTVIHYSTRYQVSADLATLIYESALKEGVDPELGFRLVYVESRFNPRAVSSAGAIGLAQVMPSTARIYTPGVTRDDLFDGTVNLRIGFRYLRHLLERYEGNLQLALLAYNRGPRRVQDLLDGGIDPSNGYASSVLDGYQAGVFSVQ